MGCSPFGRLISMAFGGNGKSTSGRKGSGRRGSRRRREYYSPEHATSQSMLRTVVYRDDVGPVVVAQPVHTVHVPPASSTVQLMAPDQGQQPRGHPAPEADISPSPHVLRAAAAAAEHDQLAGAEGVPACAAAGAGDAQFPAGPVLLYRCAPSPGPPPAAWGDHYLHHVGERRREYFGAEYRYSYPTPVREGIYRMATDANRLTTMFSDENPNACSIS